MRSLELIAFTPLRSKTVCRERTPLIFAYISCRLEKGTGNGRDKDTFADVMV